LQRGWIKDQQLLTLISASLIGDPRAEIALNVLPFLISLSYAMSLPRAGFVKIYKKHNLALSADS